MSIGYTKLRVFYKTCCYCVLKDHAFPISNVGLIFHNTVICDCVATVSVVLGIPTVKREVQSYLLATLQNILDSMTLEEIEDVLIVVFIAEVC